MAEKSGSVTGTKSTSSASRHTAVALVHYGEDLGPARLDLLDIGHRLVKQFLVARERNDETARIDERDGAVLELSGGVRLGVDVGDLLELERGFERDGVVDVAPDEEERAVAAVTFGKIADLRVQVNAALRALGQLRDTGDELGVPRRGERSALVGPSIRRAGRARRSAWCSPSWWQRRSRDRPRCT